MLYVVSRGNVVGRHSPGQSCSPTAHVRLSFLIGGVLHEAAEQGLIMLQDSLLCALLLLVGLKCCRLTYIRSLKHGA